MKPVLDFLLKPLGGQRYDNVSKKGNKKLIISTSQEDHTATNRIGVIEETPIGYKGDIQKGDEVILHHNVFRRFYNMKGVEESGPCHFTYDLYLVPFDQIYFYKKKDTWKSTGRYSFIRPITKKADDLLSLEQYEELIGEIVVGNKYLNSIGLEVGDQVSFPPDMEYEFKINDEILYRVDSLKLCVKI